MTDQYLIERQQQKLGLAAPKEEKPIRISMKSLKRKVEEKLYLKKKKEYLTEHIRCEVKGCNQISVDLHHKRGRIGKLLYDEKYFMAVCRNHHTEIETNPDEAKQNGYSLSRLKLEL